MFSTQKHIWALPTLGLKWPISEFNDLKLSSRVGNTGIFIFDNGLIV